MTPEQLQTHTITLERRPATTINLHDEDTLIVHSQGATVKIEKGTVEVIGDSVSHLSVHEKLTITPIDQVRNRQDITQAEGVIHNAATFRFSQPQYQKKQPLDTSKLSAPVPYPAESSSTGDDEIPSS